MPWFACRVFGPAPLLANQESGKQQVCTHSAISVYLLIMNTYRTSASRQAKPLPNGKFKTPESVRNYTNSLRGRMGCLIKGAKASAKAKNIEFSITLEDVLSLWIEQKGICPYTGWQMTTETRSKALVSIERKDSDKGYTRNNCILTCWIANRAKHLLTQDQFIELCSAVVANCKTNRG